jgi:hypothetical protein
LQVTECKRGQGLLRDIMCLQSDVVADEYDAKLEQMIVQKVKAWEEAKEALEDLALGDRAQAASVTVVV